MRMLLIILGVASIVLYALFGGIIMSDWAVSAASGLPIGDTIAAMQDANQPYSVLPGLIFAVAGSALAMAWLMAEVVPSMRMSPLHSFATWATIVSFGAPAYFFASFGNLNSVGDTFFDWNASAAFSFAAPLYLASIAAGITAIVAWVVSMLQSTRGSNTQVQLAQ